MGQTSQFDIIFKHKAMKLKYLYIILLIFIMPAKPASAYNFTISGYVYYNYTSVTIPDHKIYFSATDAEITDSAISNYSGYYSITFNLHEDSTYMFHIFTADSCEQGLSNFSKYIYSSIGNHIVDINACIYSNGNCQAVFYYYMLSENTVQFIDTSKGNVTEWFWDFGDNTNSSEKDPIHLYSNNGYYMVSLYIVTEDTCTSIWQNYIFIEHQEYLKGLVKAGPNLLPKGHVFLFEVDPFTQEITPVLNTSFPINLGLFSVPYSYNVPHMLYVIPDFNTPEYYYPEYFPTFSGDEEYWADAALFIPDYTDTVKIDLVKRDSVFYGHGTIKGSINTEQMWNPNMENSCVLLFDTDHKPLKYSFFNYDNTYSLNQLPYGDYYLLVNKIGISATFVLVSISENNPVAEVYFTVDKNEIVTSIPDKEMLNTEQNIFPNPFNNEVTILFTNKHNPEIPIIVYNYSGQVVHSEILSITGNKAQINLTNLCNGIYFIKTPNRTFKVQKTGY